MAYKLKTAFLALCVIMLTSCYEVDFSGLISRSESSNQRFEESMNWFSQNPERELILTSDEYLILTIGDTHVGTTNNLEHFFGIARSEGADAVIMVGDLTTGRGSDYETFYNSLPGREELPWFALVGNHDLYFGGWEHFYSLFGPSVYTVKLITPEAQDLIICLDTGSGTLGSRQTEWLKYILENTRGNYRHCMIFTHNNLFRIPRTWSTNPVVEELHVLMDLFTREGVDLFVAGHDHRSNILEFGNTTYIVVDALKDGLSNAGYLEISINGDTISHSLKRLGQQQ